MQNQNPGALLDNRSADLKAKDYKSNNPELASAVTLKWVAKPVSEWKNYPARNQDGSSSCVAQAYQKGYTVLTGKINSAHPIYRSRLNFPGEGMYLYDAGDIFRKQGTVDETEDVSQNIGEQLMNLPISAQVQLLLKDGLKCRKIGSYVFVSDFKNIDDIAEAIEKYGHCIITVQSNYNEWTSIPVVNGEPKWGHAICAIDYVIYEGKKYIVIEDSWGPNLGQFDDRRILSAEFLQTRCTGAVYMTLPVPPVPFHYTFTKTLKKGMVDVDVEALQKALKQFGFFPQIATTKTYGPVTEASVNKFQLAYKDEILTPNGLTQPTGIFGPSSIKKMNALLK